MVSEELKYLIEQEADLEQLYPGRYVAVSNRTVVAVGSTAAEVYRLVKEQKVKTPLVTYIPRMGDEALLI